MFPDGLVGDKQTQPGALAALGRVEHGEHIFDLVLIHSAAIVDDIKLNIVVFATDSKRDLIGFVGSILDAGLHGVFEDIDKG